MEHDRRRSELSVVSRNSGIPRRNLSLQHATLRLGPTRAMSYGYLTPAFVIVIEWALVHSLPSSMTLPGIAVTVAAMLVLQSGVPRTEPSRQLLAGTRPRVWPESNPCP